MTPPRIPPDERPSLPPDVLRTEKGRRVVQRFLGRRVYRDLVRGKRGTTEVEDALAEELQARAARLRRAAASGPVDKAQVAALQEGAQVLRAIVKRRNALVAMMEKLLEEGPRTGPGGHSGAPAADISLRSTRRDGLQTSGGRDPT